MAYSRRVNANILLANSLRPHLSRGLGHLYLVHARQCDISRTNQRRILISLSFAASRNATSSASASGSGGSSRHNSHVSVSRASLALGRVRAHSLIQGIGAASRSSIDLVLGRIPQPSSSKTTGTSCLGDTSDIDGSEGALSNLESHTFAFGLPVVGGAGSLHWGAYAYAQVIGFRVIIVLFGGCDVRVCEIS
jgi:hypothetical protein